MANSTLTPRRVVTAVGLVAILCLTGCSSPASSVRRVSADSSSHPGANAIAVLEDPSGSPTETGVYARRAAEYRANPAYAESHPRRILYVDALLHLGDTRGAIRELVQTEMAFPDAYLNALYLGLAYEMAGDLKSARHWVARGIERNVDARNGSEWLHLAMIDARLALAKDPNWLRKNSVLTNNTHRTAEEILEAIRIQLAVRGDFKLPADAVVCDLYFEAGICASTAARRQEYFAHSLEISSLRRTEIEKHAKVRAQAHASLQLN